MNRRTNVIAVCALLLVAIGLRAWDLPDWYELRGVDEVPYVQGSLELLEGMTPAYKYAPAGVQTWLGWAYAGSLATRYLIAPTAEERAVPIQIRPFVAVNHALFDLYRDLSGIRRFIVVITVIFSVLAVLAAFAVGLRSAGLPGGILLGGLFAVAPLMVDYSEQARSFSMAWSFFMMAVYFAGCRSWKTALWGSGILMGLAISQRIDMLVLIPIVCLESGYTARAVRKQAPAEETIACAVPRPLGAIARQLAIMAVTTLVAAPWLMTNIIGNLRTIATVRFAPPPTPISWVNTLGDFAWATSAPETDQLLGLVTGVFVIGAVYGLVTRRLEKPLICLYALLMLPSVVKSTGHQIAHQAAAVLAMFVAVPLAMAAITRSKKIVWWLVLVSLAPPFWMTCRLIRLHHWTYVPDDATAWVEHHVRSGTSLFITPIFHDPLPTAQSADALWQEEMNNDAAVKKFQAGLQRFHLDATDLPRALSEENMIVERVYRRGWYILGSRQWLPDRRYDIHLYGGSMVFGTTSPFPGYSKTGGVLIWRGGPLEGLSNPVMKWVNPDGWGTYIYCSSDKRSMLTP